MEHTGLCNIRTYSDTDWVLKIQFEAICTLHVFIVYDHCIVFTRLHLCRNFANIWCLKVKWNVSERMQLIYLHIPWPKIQVSGLVFTSTKTVGVHTTNTNKSAMLKFIRKIFVEFRMSFVFIITIGTYGCVFHVWREKTKGKRRKIKD